MIFRKGVNYQTCPIELALLTHKEKRKIGEDTRRSIPLKPKVVLHERTGAQWY